MKQMKTYRQWQLLEANEVNVNDWKVAPMEEADESHSETQIAFVKNYN